jgi:hypothetical protein
MDKPIFIEILSKLKDLNYFFISGLSVSVHTNGKRIPGDIDIVVHPNDINTFAMRLKTIAKERMINKGNFIVNDFGFEINYKGQMVECTTGYPLKRIKEETFKKLFDYKVETIYLDQIVYIEPLEELVNQKAFMHREKDIADLNLLKGKTLNKKLFMELSQDKGNLKIVLPVIETLFQFK